MLAKLNRLYLYYRTELIWFVIGFIIGVIVG
jgi:hypothetical protein